MNALFNNNFSELTQYAIVSTPYRPRYRNSCFTIFPFAQLNELIDTVCSRSFDEDDEPLYKIRFIMDSTYQVWFAEEGTPCAKIPGHGQIIEGRTCLTAGVLRFSNNIDTLKIDHKSGDYRPQFDSLKWFLAALIINMKTIKIKLPSTLSLLRLYSNGGNESESKLSIEQISQWIDENLNAVLIDAPIKQSTEKKLLEYSVNNTPTISPNTPYRRTHNNFFTSTSSHSTQTQVTLNQSDEEAEEKEPNILIGSSSIAVTAHLHKHLS